LRDTRVGWEEGIQMYLRRCRGTAVLLSAAAGPGIQVPSCTFLHRVAGDGCWVLLRRRARRKMLSLCWGRLALWLCFLDVLWSLGWWRWAFVLVSRHVFHSIVNSPAGNSASGCIRHVGFSFPAFVSIRTQLVEVFAYGAGVLGGPRQLLP
jgi:hypothetical protein